MHCVLETCTLHLWLTVQWKWYTAFAVPTQSSLELPSNPVYFPHFLPPSIMFQLVPVAVIPSEWHSVSDTYSNNESNVTQMLYSSSPTRLTRKPKQTSSTATFNQMQPSWQPFFAHSRAPLQWNSAEFVLMRDTSASNEVNHITSAPVL